MEGRRKIGRNKRRRNGKEGGERWCKEGRRKERIMEGERVEGRKGKGKEK